MIRAHSTKTSMRKRTSIAIHAALLSASAAMPVLAADLPVSPGHPRDMAPAASSCPVFSWSTESKSGIELVVAPLAAADELVFSVELPAGATSWTPPGNRCLAPGQYLWFFRPLDGPLDAWSDSLVFEISSLPTQEEVEKARAVLERFVAMGGISDAGTQQSSSEAVQPVGQEKSPGSNAEVQAASGGQAPSLPQADTAQGLVISGAALSGYYPGAGGSNAGVQGKVDAAGGAGVAAENTAVGGADLLLAGAVAGQVTEKTWKLDSESAQSFEFSNPSGNMTLKVNGQDVLTSVSPGGTEPPSMFGTFGGTSETDRTIVGTQNLDTEVATYRNLTIPVGTTLVINRPVALIAVSGTCDISGTITTVGQGRAGGTGQTSAGEFPGRPGVRSNLEGTGYGMVGGMFRVPVPMAISGAGGGGGGGGNAPQSRGGDGGGSEAAGGEGGYAPETLTGRAAGVNWDQRRLLTAGVINNNQSRLYSDFFSQFIYYPGAGGGAGAVGDTGGTGGSGGTGGGNVYIECRTANFTGTINTSGMNGGNGTGKAGGGGGGGGGVALVRALQVQSATGSVTVSGGTGGSGSGGAGAGGNGRQGLVDVVDL